ncbi:MAG: hypothetical protein M3R55_13570 [Acidobacteriota bacterium]|nr:hypothetical protein [Acidobacteriota bacterium]
MTRVAAAVLAFVPFAFALRHSIETDGLDLRYLWVAFAAFAGATLRMAISARRGGRLMTRGPMVAGVFFTSTLFAVVAAVTLGAGIGPAKFIVAAGFGACFAASTYLRMPAR